MDQYQEKLSASMEDYLETIYGLNKDHGIARVGEVAQRMSVKSSSANAAIRQLSDKGLVDHEKYGLITLTPKGESLAIDVQNKHDILFRFLTEFLMLDASVADKEACGIEHAISEDTYDRLTKFFKFLEFDTVRKKPKLLQLFEIYLKTGERRPCDCEKR